MMRLLCTACSLMVLFTFATVCVAQEDVAWQADVGDWSDDDNWQGGFKPQAMFNESAVISNGGTAQVATDDLPPPAGVDVGPGTVEIHSGRVLGVEGLFNLLGQEAMLSVASGGTISPQSLFSSGIMELNGPSAAANIEENLTLASGSTLVVNINGPTFQPISVGEIASLSGTLNVNFNGVTPTVGDSWDLVDASLLGISFESIKATGVGPLGLGQVLDVRQQPGGANGAVAQIALEQKLVLNVNRDTGMVSIDNPGEDPVSMDGYVIGSQAGSIDQAAWNSLEDQELDSGSWRKSSEDANGLAELNPTTTSSFGASSSTPLGPIYDPNFSTVGFGGDAQDIEFTYTAPGQETVEGVVNYEGQGVLNNLVLRVNEDGQALLQNDSPFTVAMDVYTITSASGSLLPADGNWNSLEDQGAAGDDWREIEATRTTLGELKEAGATTLNPDDTLPLGTLFDTSGTPDLDFRFLLEGEFEARVGDVVFETTTALVGDYNGNGVVDAADYTVWRDSAGRTGTGLAADGNDDEVVDQADYTFWKNRFGNIAGSGSNLAGASAAGATAVPESSALQLLVVAVVAAGIQRGCGYRLRLSGCHADLCYATLSRKRQHLPSPADRLAQPQAWTSTL